MITVFTLLSNPNALKFRDRVYCSDAVVDIGSSSVEEPRQSETQWLAQKC